MSQTERVLIEPMTEEDVDDVLAIERAVFSLPWSRRGFLVEVQDKKVAVARVARSAGRVVGYSVSWRVVDELHIGNIGVDPSQQGRGVGRALLEDLIDLAARESLLYATLEVRAGNARAIRLYERGGFDAVAIRRRYYPDNDEDALVMIRYVTPDGRPKESGE